MPIIAKLDKDCSIIEQENGNSVYSQGWFGSYAETGYLILDPYETALLLERNRIEVLNNEGKSLMLSEVVSHFSNNIPDFLVHFLLFKDLRGRGYVVKKKSANDKYFEMYERGSTPNKAKHEALVVPMVEGLLFNVDSIDKIVKEAKDVNQQLIFAVIDSLGDVSYYSVSELEFQNLNNQEKSEKQ